MRSDTLQRDSTMILYGNNYEDSVYQSKQSSFKIFYLFGFDTLKKSGFITMSEVDNLSEDEPVVPSKYLGNRALKDIKYFKLDSIYRKRFLKRTHLNETDSVFIYSYSNNILLRFAIKNLDVVSHINIFTSDGDSIRKEDFMIGLEIKQKFLINFEEHFSNTFVNVGKENPFVTGLMKPIVWEETTSPVSYKQVDLPEYASHFSNYKPGKAYTFVTDSFEYFAREMIIDNKREGYHIVVNSRKSNNIVYNHASYNSEGSHFKPLNNIDPYLGGPYQWTGKLFKGKPQVIFGFGWESFGCESIYFLERSAEPYITILCDNRH